MPSRVNPISTGFSSGISACDHTESALPSHIIHGDAAALNAVGELRLTAPRLLLDVGSPSAKASSGAWQVAQRTSWFEEKRLSKNTRKPSSAAEGSSAWALPRAGGSAAGS